MLLALPVGKTVRLPRLLSVLAPLGFGEALMQLVALAQAEALAAAMLPLAHWEYTAEDVAVKETAGVALSSVLWLGLPLMDAEGRGEVEEEGHAVDRRETLLLPLPRRGELVPCAVSEATRPLAVLLAEAAVERVLAPLEVGLGVELDKPLWLLHVLVEAVGKAVSKLLGVKLPDQLLRALAVPLPEELPEALPILVPWAVREAQLLGEGEARLLLVPPLPVALSPGDAVAALVPEAVAQVCAEAVPPPPLALPLPVPPAL